VAAKTLSSREFNRDVGGAKRAANEGPVFITDRGQPAHVLLSIDDYRRLVGGQATMADLLALPGAEDIDFEPPKVGDLARPAEFS
jgi:prevent-host-death family protein